MVTFRVDEGNENPSLAFGGGIMVGPARVDGAVLVAGQQIPEEYRPGNLHRS